MVFLFHNIIYLIFLFGPFTVYVYKLKSIERHLGSHFICNDDEYKLYNKNAQKLLNKNAQFIGTRIIQVLHSGGNACVNKH